MSNCTADNKATCRFHNKGLRAAKKVLINAITSHKLSNSDALKAMSMLKTTEKYEENRKALGMVVTYKDGSTEVFFGEATDPKEGSDWAFTSSNGTLKEVAYDDNETDYVETGVKDLKSYQKHMEEMLINSSPVYSEGLDKHRSDKVVKEVTVL